VKVVVTGSLHIFVSNLNILFLATFTDRWQLYLRLSLTIVLILLEQIDTLLFTSQLHYDFAAQVPTFINAHIHRVQANGTSYLTTVLQVIFFQLLKRLCLGFSGHLTRVIVCVRCLGAAGLGDEPSRAVNTLQLEHKQLHSHQPNNHKPTSFV